MPLISLIMLSNKSCKLSIDDLDLLDATKSHPIELAPKNDLDEADNYHFTDRISMTGSEIPIILTSADIRIAMVCLPVYFWDFHCPLTNHSSLVTETRLFCS